MAGVLLRKDFMDVVETLKRVSELVRRDRLRLG
jgi:hypothetical protein